MKPILNFAASLLVTGVVCFVSCKKETYVTPDGIVPPTTDNQQLISPGVLSIPRDYVCAATAGSKILFAGGATLAAPAYIPSSRVDIYDTVTKNWSTAELSMPRTGLVATTLGNKIYFTDGFGNASSRVDIYDASTNSWSTAEFSSARAGLASGAAVNKVVFAGGYASFGDKIDIYDTSANNWSTAILNEPRSCISATSVGNKIYFSGGLNHSGTLSNKVDIYDAPSNSWSAITMTETRTLHTSIGVDNKIFWAGGYSSFDSQGEHVSNNSVEIYDVNNGGRTYHQLSRCPFTACIMKNKIIFFSAFYGTSFIADVYDITTQSWSVSDILFPVPTAIGWPQSIIGAGNKIYISEGLNISNQSKVWKVTF